MDKKNFCFKLYPVNKEISKVWFVKYRDAAGRPQKSYGRLRHYNTVAERLKEAKRLIIILQKPVVEDIIKRNKLIINLSNALEYRRPSLEKKSYQTYFSILKYFAAWYHLEYKKDKHISPAAYIMHLHSLGKHNNTIRRANVLLKDLFNVLIREGHYAKNPFEFVKVKKIKAKSLLPFHQVQIAALKELIIKRDPQLWDAILFEYYLFFRPKEIRLLQVKHILFDAMQIILDDKIAKDDDNYLKAIPMPMQQTILKFQYLPKEFFLFSNNDKPGIKKVGVNNFCNRHRHFIKALQLGERYAFYSWVHTGIKAAAMAGIPHKQLQLQKGHSDLKMFDEYLKDLNINDCVELVNNFPEI